MSHHPGCPCNSSNYATCTCERIELRQHTEALERHTEVMRSDELIRTELSAEKKRADDNLDMLNAVVSTFAAEKIRLLNVAKGCHDYGGGYREPKEAEIFHHGIDTVIAALTAALKNDPNDLQVAILERVGKHLP